VKKPAFATELKVVVRARFPTKLGNTVELLLLSRILASADNTAPLDIVILSEPSLPVNTPELSKAPVLVPVAVIWLR
jgi:hypothetical protein